MINTILFLVFVSLFGFLHLRMRYDKIVSWLMFFACSLLFLDYQSFINIELSQSFSLLWNKTPLGDIAIEYMPSIEGNLFIILMFIISILMVFINNLFRYEEKTSFFNSIIILNLITLCLLVSSNNYVQLLTAVFVVDILGYILINNVDSSRKYVIYNFISDMFLFMSLALVCGKLNSLDMSLLSQYKVLGHHKDFVSVVLLLALFIKLGLFLFQGYLLDLSNTRFQRLIAINTLFSPLVGIVLLLKLQNIILISNLFAPIYLSFCLLSILYGMIYLIKTDNLLQKIIYLNMNFIGLILLMLYANNFIWINLLSYIYMVMFIVNILLFSVYLAVNRENNLYHIQISRGQNLPIIKFSIVLLILVLNIFLSLVYTVLVNNMFYYFLLLSSIIALLLCFVFAQVYYLSANQKFSCLDLRKNSYLFIILGLFTALFLSYYMRNYNYYNVLIIFSLAIFIYLLRFAISIIFVTEKKTEKCQICDDVLKILIVKPLVYISRKLWIIFDFVVSEKFINYIFATFYKHVIYLFLKLNKKSTLTYILYFLLGMIIFLFSIYKGAIY